MDDRTHALEEIARLARAHAISAAEISAALEDQGTKQDGRLRAVLVRVLGYLGGTFVFAGVGVFIALQWDHLGSAARVVVTLGPGIAALVLALLASRESRYEAAVTPLFLAAAALEPTGMLVAFDEFGTGGDWRIATLIVSAVMALQFGGTFGSLRRSAALFLTIFFAVIFWWTAFDLADIDGNLTAVILGGSMMLAAFGAGGTRHDAVAPPWYFLGSAVFLAGLFDILEGTPLEILFLAVAASFVYVSVLVHSRTLLLVSVLAILTYTGWFTNRHFADSIGWPLALVAFGLFMIALSALAFRIDREYVTRKAP